MIQLINIYTGTVKPRPQSLSKRLNYLHTLLLYPGRVAHRPVLAVRLGRRGCRGGEHGERVCDGVVMDRQGDGVSFIDGVDGHLGNVNSARYKT